MATYDAAMADFASLDDVGKRAKLSKLNPAQLKAFTRAHNEWKKRTGANSGTPRPEVPALATDITVKEPEDASQFIDPNVKVRAPKPAPAAAPQPVAAAQPAPAAPQPARAQPLPEGSYFTDLGPVGHAVVGAVEAGAEAAGKAGQAISGATDALKKFGEEHPVISSLFPPQIQGARDVQKGLSVLDEQARKHLSPRQVEDLGFLLGPGAMMSGAQPGIFPEVFGAKVAGRAQARAAEEEARVRAAKWVGSRFINDPAPKAAPAGTAQLEGKIVRVTKPPTMAYKQPRLPARAIVTTTVDRLPKEVPTHAIATVENGRPYIALTYPPRNLQPPGPDNPVFIRHVPFSNDAARAVGKLLIPATDEAPAGIWLSQEFLKTFGTTEPQWIRHILAADDASDYHFNNWEDANTVWGTAGIAAPEQIAPWIADATGLSPEEVVPVAKKAATKLPVEQPAKVQVVKFNPPDEGDTRDTVGMRARAQKHPSEVARELTERKIELTNEVLKVSGEGAYQQNPARAAELRKEIKKVSDELERVVKSMQKKPYSPGAVQSAQGPVGAKGSLADQSYEAAQRAGFLGPGAVAARGSPGRYIAADQLLSGVQMPSRAEPFPVPRRLNPMEGKSEEWHRMQERLLSSVNQNDQFAGQYLNAEQRLDRPWRDGEPDPSGLGTLPSREVGGAGMAQAAVEPGHSLDQLWGNHDWSDITAYRGRVAAGDANYLQHVEDPETVVNPMVDYKLQGYARSPNLKAQRDSLPPVEPDWRAPQSPVRAGGYGDELGVQPEYQGPLRNDPNIRIRGRGEGAGPASQDRLQRIKEITNEIKDVSTNWRKYQQTQSRIDALGDTSEAYNLAAQQDEKIGSLGFFYVTDPLRTLDSLAAEFDLPSPVGPEGWKNFELLMSQADYLHDQHPGSSIADVAEASKDLLAAVQNAVRWSERTPKLAERYRRVPMQAAVKYVAEKYKRINWDPENGPYPREYGEIVQDLEALSKQLSNGTITPEKVMEGLQATVRRNDAALKDFHEKSDLLEQSLVSAVEEMLSAAEAWADNYKVFWGDPGRSAASPLPKGLQGFAQDATKGGAPKPPPFKPAEPNDLAARGPVTPAKPPMPPPVDPNPNAITPFSPPNNFGDMDAMFSVYREGVAPVPTLEKIANYLGGAKHTRAPADVASVLQRVIASRQLTKVYDEASDRARKLLNTTRWSEVDRDLHKLVVDPRWNTGLTAQRQKLWQEFEGKHGAFSQAAKEYTEGLISDVADVSAQLAARGYVSDDLEVARQMGLLDLYSKRTYLAFADPKNWPRRVPAKSLMDLARYIQSQRGEVMTTNEIVSEMLRIVRARTPMGQIHKEGKVGKVMASLLTRKDVPKEIREALGENLSGTDSLALSLGTQRALLAMLDAADHAASLPNVASPVSNPALGHTYQIGSDRRFGNLRNMWVGRDVYEAFGTLPNVEAASHELAHTIASFLKGQQVGLGGGQVFLNSLVQNIWGGTLTGSIDLTRPRLTWSYFRRAWHAIRDYHADPTGNTGEGWAVAEALRSGGDYHGFGAEEIGSPHARKFFRDLDRVFPKHDVGYIEGAGDILKAIMGRYRGLQEWGGKAMDFFDRWHRIQSHFALTDRFLADLATDGMSSELVTEGLLQVSNPGELARLMQAAAKARVIRNQTDRPYFTPADRRSPRWDRRGAGQTDLTAGQSGPLNVNELDQEAYRKVVEAAASLSARRTSMSFWNPTTPAPGIDSMRRGLVGIANPYLTAAAEGYRINAQLFVNIVDGNVVPGRLMTEKGLAERLGKLMLILGGALGAGGVVRWLSGIRDDDVKVAMASLPVSWKSQHPTAFVAPFRDSKGRPVVIDPTRSIDVFRMLIGHPNDALWRKIISNFLMTPVESGLLDPYARSAVNATRLSRQQSFTSNLVNSLYGTALPGAARGVIEGGRLGGLWGEVRPTEEELTPAQTALRMMNFNNFRPVTIEPTRERWDPRLGQSVEAPNPSWNAQAMEGRMLIRDQERSVRSPLPETVGDAVNMVIKPKREYLKSKRERVREERRKSTAEDSERNDIKHRRK